MSWQVWSQPEGPYLGLSSTRLSPSPDKRKGQNIPGLPAAPSPALSLPSPLQQAFSEKRAGPQIGA